MDESNLINSGYSYFFLENISTIRRSHRIISCGIPGEMEGERYKRDPQLVRQYLQQHQPFEAPAKYLVFKRWDRLHPGDELLAVVFFASGDVLAGFLPWRTMIFPSRMV